MSSIGQWSFNYKLEFFSFVGIEPGQIIYTVTYIWKLSNPFSEMHIHLGIRNCLMTNRVVNHLNYSWWGSYILDVMDYIFNLKMAWGYDFFSEDRSFHPTIFISMFNKNNADQKISMNIFLQKVECTCRRLDICFRSHLFVDAPPPPFKQNGLSQLVKKNVFAIFYCYSRIQ